MAYADDDEEGARIPNRKLVRPAAPPPKVQSTTAVDQSVAPQNVAMPNEGEKFNTSQKPIATANGLLAADRIAMGDVRRLVDGQWPQQSTVTDEQADIQLAKGEVIEFVPLDDAKRMPTESLENTSSDDISAAKTDIILNQFNNGINNEAPFFLEKNGNYLHPKYLAPDFPGRAEIINNWLCLPGNAEIAHDDIENLSIWARPGQIVKKQNMERIVHGREFYRQTEINVENSWLGRIWREINNGVDRAILLNSDGTPNAFGHFVNQSREDGLKAGQEQLSNKEYADLIDSRPMGEIYYWASDQLEEIEDSGLEVTGLSDVNSPEMGMRFVIDNATVIASEMTTLGLGAAAPAVMWLDHSAEVNQELKSHTSLPPDERATHASIISGPLLGLDLVTLKLGGMLGGEATKGFLRTFGKKALEEGLSEGLTEGFQEAVIIGGVALSGGGYTADEVLTRLSNSFVTGGLFGAASTGVDLFQEAKTRLQAYHDARDSQQFFTVISQAATDSKLRIRSPEKFQEALEYFQKAGPIKYLYIGPQDLAAYLESQGIDPHSFVNDIRGMPRGALARAIENHTDLKIPTASYATSIAGGPLDEFMMQNMRLDRYHLSKLESDKINEVLPSIIESAKSRSIQLEAVGLPHEAVDSVYKEVFVNLKKQNYPAAEANEIATFYTVVYTDIADSTGIPLKDLLKKFPLGTNSFEGKTAPWTSPRKLRWFSYKAPDGKPSMAPATE